MHPKIINSLSAFIIVIAVIHFWGSRESRKLANKYGMQTYRLNSEAVEYVGFYNSEKWKPGYFRWSSRQGLMRFYQKSNLQITLYLAHPDIHKKPVTAGLFLNNQVLDRIVASKPGYIERCYSLTPDINGRTELLIEVSRIWEPLDFGLGNDSRHLGVAVGRVHQVASCSSDEKILAN